MSATDSVSPGPPTDRADVVPMPIGVELYIDAPARVRSPGDILRLLIGVALFAAGLVLATFADETIGGLETDLIDSFTRLPDQLEQFVLGISQIVAIVVIASLTVVLVVRRRWRHLVALGIAAATTVVAMRLLDAALDVRESAGAITRESVTAGWLNEPGFPSPAYLAVTASIVTIASVWLSRRWKRAAWGAVAALMLLRVVSSHEPALDVMLSLSVGMIVGSALLVVFGAPNPAPRGAELIDALSKLVPDLRRVRTTEDRAGTRCYVAERGATRDSAFVKLRTPDDRTSDLLNRLYRAARLKRGEVERPYATVQRRIEHEALATSQAARAGVRSPGFVGIATLADGATLLVTEAVPGRRLSKLAADAYTDELLGDLWREVAALHRAEIAHRNLHVDNVVVDLDGRPWIVDYDEARLAATPRVRAMDVAQLLVETALVVGPGRAARAAVAVLGPDEVARSLPLLQPLALTSRTRRALRGDRGLLDVLAHEIHNETGAAEIHLEELRRFRPRTILAISALAAAFYFLLPQLADIDETFDAFADADWRWGGLVLVASAATYVFATLAFIGSVADPVPVGPAARAQVAASFASSITPASAGGMALGIRLLQRTGLDAGTAGASVGLNRAAGVLVHLTLMVSFIAWAGQTDVGGFSLPDTTVTLVAIAIVLGCVGVALLIRPVRRAVLVPVIDSIRSGLANLAGVMSQPARVAALLGGSIGVTMSYVVALALAVQAFGGGLTFAQIGAAYLAASIVGSAAPTPGGLGAVEAAMVATLTGFGLVAGVAVSAVLVFRLATYWLPILPGWGAFHWMQHRQEL